MGQLLVQSSSLAESVTILVFDLLAPMQVSGKLPNSVLTWERTSPSPERLVMTGKLEMA